MRISDWSSDVCSSDLRSGRTREEVTVSRTKLSIRKFSPAGRVVEHRFNPFWARFGVNRHEEFGITSMYVTGEGRWTDIGSFPNPDDRESFAKAFRGALASVTQGLGGARRSEERRVGTECVRPCRLRWSP